MSLADHPNHITTRAGLDRVFGLSFFRPERDSLLGFDASGRMIASGMAIMPGFETLARSIIFGGVHPAWRGRGIGSLVLAWQLGRARQQLEATADDVVRWVVAFTDERAPQDRRLFESAGLQLARHFVAMERILAEPIDPPPVLHRGIRLATFSPDLSDAVLRARNEAFRDHWGSQPLSDEAWRTLIGDPTFRPGLSFVAMATASVLGGTETRSGAVEEVVGFLLGSVNAADWPHQGFTDSHVPMVGVRPAWRGRHIAQALIARHLEESRALGHERVTLDADTSSATGALALYERLGFRHTHRKLAFVAEV